MKKYPIKEFLTAESGLVKFNQKEAAQKPLNQSERAKRSRTYELREKTFRKIRDAIAKYYESVIDGNYSYDGMPQIKRGVCGGIETKIWRLLIEIGEPGHVRYRDCQDDYGDEAK